MRRGLSRILRAVAYPSGARRVRDRHDPGGRIRHVVLFFEILLGLATVLIIWFAFYVIYRLVNDES